MRKYFIGIVTVFLLFISYSSSYAQDEITLKVNGSIIETDQPAQIVNDRTMVPVRFISEALGAQVTWDSESRTVLIAATLGNNTVNLQKLAQMPGIKIVVDGNLIQTDQAPVIINGRTMVPVRFVSEALGADVTWDGSTRSVIINKESNTNSLDQLLQTTFKIESYYAEEYEWPHYLLVPETWKLTEDEELFVERYISDDGLTLRIEAALYAMPLVRPPSRYSYYGADWLTGEDKTDYEQNHPVIMGGMPGYHFRYRLDDGRYREKYIIRDRNGYCELDFDAEKKILDKYNDVIAVMVSSFQTPLADDDAFDKVVTAMEYQNFNLKINSKMGELPTLSQVEGGQADAETAYRQWTEMAAWIAAQDVDRSIEGLYKAEKSRTDNMVKYLNQLQGGAGEQELAETRENIAAAAMEGVNERLKLHGQVFSGFKKIMEPNIGSFKTYSWDSGIIVNNGPLSFKLLVPEGWSQERQHNGFTAADPTNKYSFKFYLETGFEEFYDTEFPEETLAKYAEVWGERLSDKEIVFSYYGVMYAAAGMHVIYQDKKEGEDVFVNLFFTLGADNVFYVIETVIPQDSKPDEFNVIGDQLYYENVSFDIFKM